MNLNKLHPKGYEKISDILSSISLLVLANLIIDGLKPIPKVWNFTKPGNVIEIVGCVLLILVFFALSIYSSNTADKIEDIKKKEDKL